MEEFKIKYSHNKAKSILKNIGAKFKEKALLEDFYLKSDANSIWKFSKEKDKVYLVNLTKEKYGFGINLSERLGKKATISLLSFFKENPLIMKKIREHYNWKGAKIVLDNVVGLGEFIELYPKGKISKEKLFEVFDINSSDLITKSYYDMWKKK